MSEDNKIWPDFGKESDIRIVEDSDEGLAKLVLDTLGIPTGTLATEGGALKGVDIKRMDAMSIIKASLLEAMVDGAGICELTIDAHGNVCIVSCDGGTPSPSDVYFTTQTYTYQSGDTNVIVTGGVPIPERYLGTETELLSETFNKKIWSADVISSACAMVYLDRFVTITYDDPHLTTAYEDGIDNLHNITDPYESVIGYTYKISPVTDKDVEVTFNNTSIIPIRISGLGELIKTEEEAKDYANQHPDCLRGIGKNVECNVEIEIPEELLYDSRKEGAVVSKFLSIEGIYILGFKGSISFLPKEEGNSLEDPNEENTIVWFYPEDATPDLIKLTEGKNYAVCYDNNTVMVAFADRAPIDMQGMCGPETTVRVPMESITNDVAEVQYDLLPVSETEAVQALEIWAAVVVDTPCINIFSPKGVASEIAENFSVKITPVLLRQKPAPIAIDGIVYDQSYQVADNDPTTTQNFDDSPLETMLGRVGFGTGMSLSMASLDENGCVSLSSVLKGAYDKDKGIGTVWLCGPDCGHVQVGEDGVYSVEYRYNDKSSATISVSTGPIISGNFSTSLSGGAYQKRDESVTVQGVITGHDGKANTYNVNLDGLGKRIAKSGVMDVLNVGDIVTVSIHNNPVEA